MSNYMLGLKALKRLVTDQDSFKFVNFKLHTDLFKGEEASVFAFIRDHQANYHTLPAIQTLASQFPDMAEVEAPEPAKYYVERLEKRYAYTVIDKANQDSQAILKADKDAHVAAEGVLTAALNQLTQLRYRHRILDFAKDGPKLLLAAYHNLLTDSSKLAQFGWPYMDHQMGGLMGGDVVSIVGRPATGKTWHTLYMADHNAFGGPGLNTLVCSMEMNTLAIAQRQAALYAGTNVGQLKTGGYSSLTFGKFTSSLQALQKEDAKLYLVDGNLAASVEDIYNLAAVLDCKLVLIDGAYLLKHRNAKLDRFTRVAENVELMKRLGSDLNIPTVASWQFNRKASEKNGKKGEEAGLEDIGYTDAIGQISSIVLGLLQAEGVETMVKRSVKVLKGRSGETGSFDIKWDFNNMDFRQWGLKAEDESDDAGALSHL